jgi:hypothetical protein
VTGKKGRRLKQLLDELIEKERILERERRNAGNRFHPFYRPRSPLGRVEVKLYSVFRPLH